MNVKKEVIAASLLILSIQFITNVAGEYRVTSNALKTFANEILNLAKNSAMLWQRKTGRCPYEEEADDFLWKMTNPSILEWDDELQDAALYSYGIVTRNRRDADGDSPGQADRLDEAIDAMSFVHFYFKMLLEPMRNDETDAPSLYGGGQNPDLSVMCKGRESLGHDCTEKQMSIAHKILPATGELHHVLGRLLSDLKNIKCPGYSPADYLHALLTYASITEVKIYILNVYTYYLRYKETKENPSCRDPLVADSDPTTTLEKLYNDLRIRLDAYDGALRRHLSSTNITTFTACDPEVIRPHSTYFELEGLLEYVYIATNDKSVNIPKRKSNRRATVTCNDIPPRAMLHPEYSVGTIPRPCAGTLKNCEVAPPQEICYSGSSYKRYMWVRRYKEGLPPKECDGTVKIIKARQGIDRVCRCVCADTEPFSQSTHLASLVPVASDVSNNMIVTGVRFKVQHRILYLQIQQGKISKNFHVEEATWKPIEDISKNVRAKMMNKPLNGRSDTRTATYKIEDLDTFTLATNELPHGLVVTGVKFVKMDDHTFGIAVTGTQYNPTTGKLNLDCISTSRDSLKNDQLVKVQHNPVSINMQSVTPYFDGVAVEAKPSRPLAGIATIVKKVNDADGISLRLISPNYLNYMDNQREKC